MTERAEDLQAAPADAAGHQGAFGTPDQEMSADQDHTAGPTNADPAKGGDRGSWLPIVIWLAVVLAVAFFVLFAHGS